VALFLGLAGNMNNAERNKQALMASGHNQPPGDSQPRYWYAECIHHHLAGIPWHHQDGEFLGLAGNMNNAERNKQALMASVYVFAILMVSWYGIRKPIKATINPPAIRSPGIDMPNVFITTWPAYHVFAILMVSWYAGQVVMNTFGISIPGLRIAGGLIVVVHIAREAEEQRHGSQRIRQR
jgi:small neutral amino acid transporter SnatA (MarC family)